MELKELEKSQIIAVFNALLTDGADNSNMVIMRAQNGASCAELCGYGDGNETVREGTYLFVWDKLGEDDHMWPALYEIINNSQKFPYQGFDILFPLENGKDDCVLIFKLA